MSLTYPLTSREERAVRSDASNGVRGRWWTVPVLGATLCAALAPAQTRLDARTQVKSVDFSAAAYTKPFRTGIILPPTCAESEVFLKLDAPAGSNIHICTAGSWSQVVSLNQSAAYVNPAWIASLDWSKITGLPALAVFDQDGSLTIPGGIQTGDAATGAGSIVALRGTGTAKLGVEGALSGQWDIAAPDDFASWTFTPPPAPCAAGQWWTTDSTGVGRCQQPAFADIQGALQTGQLGGSVAGDLSGTLPAPSVARVNGTTVPASSSADQTLVTTAAGAASWVALPSCTEASGNRLNYDPAAHAFTCGAGGGSGGGTVTHTAGQLTANAPVVGNGGSDIRSGSATGNTTTFVTSTGTRADGNCAKWDADGNLVDSGGACGGGGGGAGPATVIIGGAFSPTGGYQLSAGATMGFMPFSTTAIASYASMADWPVPLSGTLRNFHITNRSGGNNQPADNSMTCTIYRNGSATTLAITFPAGWVNVGLITPDTTHTVSVNAGDKIHMRCVNSAASGSAQINSWSMVLQ